MSIKDIIKADLKSTKVHNKGPIIFGTLCIIVSIILLLVKSQGNELVEDIGNVPYEILLYLIKIFDLVLIIISTAAVTRLVLDIKRVNKDENKEDTETLEDIT